MSEEVKRLRNLNIELMETLIYAIQHVLKYTSKHNIPLPDEDTLTNLLRHATSVIREINEEIALHSRIFKSRKLASDEFLQGNETDEDLTEPTKKALIKCFIDSDARSASKTFRKASHSFQHEIFGNIQETTNCCHYRTQHEEGVHKKMSAIRLLSF